MRIHQNTQLITNFRKYIVWISLCYLLHPLYLSVKLLALRGGRVNDLFVLLLQIIDDTFCLSGHTLNFFV